MEFLMKQISDQLTDLERRVREHPVGRMNLSREALNQFAMAQYRDSRVWPGWFVTMRDIVDNPVLKAGLDHNFKDEVGGSGTVSHMTLCLEFIRSLGLEPSSRLAGEGSIGRHAESLIDLIPNMTEAEIGGWVLGTERLVPALFALFLRHFEKLGTVDTRYLTDHITVDVGDHAVQMLEGCRSIIDSDPRMVGEVVFGIELAGRFTLSVPDEIMARYATVSRRTMLEKAAAA